MVRSEDDMKRFPFSWPETSFIVLVIILPLSIALICTSATLWGTVTKCIVGVAVGFCLWIALVYIACRKHDGNKHDNDAA